MGLLFFLLLSASTSPVGETRQGSAASGNFPPRERPPGLTPELEADVVKSAHAFIESLTDDIIEDVIIAKTLASFSDFLGNATTQRAALEAARHFRLVKSAYDRLDLISGRCREKRLRRLVFFVLSFLREINLVGKNATFICKMESLLGVIESCQDVTAFRLVIAVIMTTVDFPAGGLCLSGAAEGLFAFVSTTEFGAADWDLLSLFAIWSSQMTGIPGRDRNAMCAMAERMVRNREKWDEQIQQYYCWLASNVRCPAMSDAQLAELFATRECKEFLATTNTVILA
jgi:hypothetical protein